MKKIVLFFFILNLNLSYAQCELEFKEILNSLLLNSSEFDTYVLEKGFDYNSDLKKYVCNFDQEKYYFGNIIERTLDGNRLTVTYSTHSKNTYLLNKYQIEQTDFKFIGNNVVSVKNMNVFSYKHKNIDLTLATETYENEITYFVSIQILLTE